MRHRLDYIIRLNDRSYVLRHADIDKHTIRVNVELKKNAREPWSCDRNSAERTAAAESNGQTNNLCTTLTNELIDHSAKYVLQSSIHSSYY